MMMLVVTGKRIFCEWLCASTNMLITSAKSERNNELLNFLSQELSWVHLSKQVIPMILETHAKLLNTNEMARESNVGCKQQQPEVSSPDCSSIVLVEFAKAAPNERAMTSSGLDD